MPVHCDYSTRFGSTTKTVVRVSWAIRSTIDHDALLPHFPCRSCPIGSFRTYWCRVPFASELSLPKPADREDSMGAGTASLSRVGPLDRKHG